MKKTLEQRQLEMKQRHRPRRPRGGRPTATESVDDLGIARQHLIAFKLLRLGHDTHVVAKIINELFDREITREAVERWVERGMPLLNQRLAAN